MGIASRRQSKSFEGKLFVGARRSMSGSATIGMWTTHSAIKGPWVVRRTFSQINEYPTTLAGTGADETLAAGAIPWHSIKGSANPANFANGSHDAWLTQLAAAFPTNFPCFLTIFHEPEADMTGSQFVGMYQHCYSVLKSANPNLQVGPIHGNYQWRPATTTTTVPDDWWVGANHCDFLAIDTYWDGYRGQAQPVYNNTWFMRWHNWAATKGKPLAITEIGFEYDAAAPNPLQRGDALYDSAIWAEQNGYISFQYWDSDNNRHWYLDDDAYATQRMHQVSERGRKPFPGQIV